LHSKIYVYTRNIIIFKELINIGYLAFLEKTIISYFTYLYERYFTHVFQVENLLKLLFQASNMLKSEKIWAVINPHGLAKLFWNILNNADSKQLLTPTNVLLCRKICSLYIWIWQGYSLLKYKTHIYCCVRPILQGIGDEKSGDKLFRC